jgi:AraC-like DNA-binding protein
MEIFNDIVADRRIYTSALHTHSHHHAQLIIPLQGEMAIQTDAQNLRLDDRTLFFVPPECEHTYHSLVRNEFLVVDIPHFMVGTSGLHKGGAAFPLNPQWQGIRYLILNEMDRNPLHGSALRELFPYIAHCLHQNQQPASIQYIHEHYHENLSVQQLAELEHYNRSYYCEWFHKVTGKSPSAYIQEVRLNKAKELLRDTDLPILHIAIQVGLEHQSSLTRLFHRCEGMSPSVYRTQFKRGKFAY